MRKGLVLSHHHVNPEAGTALKQILSLLFFLFVFGSKPSLEVRSPTRCCQYTISYFAGRFSKVSQSIRAEYAAQGQGCPSRIRLRPFEVFSRGSVLIRNACVRTAEECNSLLEDHRSEKLLPCDVGEL